jgi:2-oxoglutarate ferredoxin oxidoreductase subunit beta
MAESLIELSEEYKKILHPLHDYEIKHEQKILVYSAHGENFGNAKLPSKGLLHGRAPAIATGLKLARPELKVFVVTGDGDGLSIGGNHLLHVLRRNVDVTILLFNNRIYGLTKGQYSPTSELGKVTKSTPMGSADRPLSPCSFALAAGASFVARTVDRNIAHLEETLRRAATHKGAAFVEILQNCNVYNDLAWNVLYDRESKALYELKLQHGKPLVFGTADDRRGLVLEGVKPKVVKVKDVPVCAARTPTGIG